ncbi:MAG: hypothetical protein ABI779_23795 [Acidobacteriota bacterium]
MRHRIASFLVATLLLSACATTSPSKNGGPARPANIKEWMSLQSRSKRKAVAGAIIGGLFGAITATITGGSGEDILEHALAGAVAGAVAGFAIGKHEDQVFAGRDLAVRQAGYDRSQGYIARVEEVSFDPASPRPGQAATLYVRYVVLGPNPNEALKIRMFRGLKYGEDYILGAGPNEFVIPKGGGIVESTMVVTLPKKAPAGTYSIEALLEDSKDRFPQVVGTGALYIARAQSRGGAVMAAR